MVRRKAFRPELLSVLRSEMRLSTRPEEDVIGGGAKPAFGTGTEN